MALSAPERQSREERFRLLAGMALAGFGLVTLGLLRLQVAEHDRYAELSKENRVRLEVLRAPRGAIYDRNGELLADSAPSFTILFSPFPAESAQRAAVTRTSAWLGRVSRLTGVDSTEVRRLVSQANHSGHSSPLLRDAPFSVLAGVEESRAELPGIEVQVEPLRRYPNGSLAAHLLGYAGEINDAELDSLTDQGYQSGDLLGRSGVERSYEDILRGHDGAEYVVVNAMGKRVSALAGEPPRPPVAGHDLVLTLDLKVQRALEVAMRNVARGAAVVVDPRDGGILALVSRPAFDPNEFSHGLSYERWDEMNAGSANPLLDRAIQGMYPPGSTFKIITMMAGMRAGVVNPGTRLQPCNGHFQFGSRAFGCWKHEGHGSLDLVEALAKSCDVYFYQVGLALGLSRIEAAAREFGLGDRTGVDLPQERRGLVPSESFYDHRFGAGRWSKGLVLNIAIGQGELLVTPLQLALLCAESANGGHAVRPHIVREVRGVQDFHQPKPSQDGFDAPPKAWDALHTAMQDVVDDGTATLAKIPGIPIAGKTGTAQNPHGKDHALFICYAPADRPSLAMSFVVENSGHGGVICAPIAGEVIRRVLGADTTHVAPVIAKRVVRDTMKVDTTGVENGD